jgi:hypothetical protein
MMILHDCDDTAAAANDDDDDDVKSCSSRDMSVNTSQFTFNRNTPTANTLWRIDPLLGGDPVNISRW